MAKIQLHSIFGQPLYPRTKASNLINDTGLVSVSNSGAAGQVLMQTAQGPQWQPLPDSSAVSKFKYFSSAPENLVTFSGLNIPVGVETSTGTYYPVQKGSLQVNTDSVTLDITSYLAYQDIPSLTGTWRAWFSAGQQVSNSIDLSGYYDKEQIDGILSNSYYNKEQITQLFAQFSDSALGNYYTKSQIDSIAGSLSDSIASVKSALSSCYTSSQVDTLVQGLSNSISSLKQELHGSYYTKNETDQLVHSLSDSIEGIKSSLQGYYNKDEVDSFLRNISDSIADIKSTFNSYYTSSQVDQLVHSLSDSIEGIKSSLESYYTKTQIEGFLGSLSNSIEAVRSTFSQYYTKDEVLQVLSDSYYDKAEIEGLLGEISNSLTALDNKITQQKSYNNLDNKPSIAGVTLQGNVTLDELGLPQFVGSYLTFSAVDADNKYTINGTTTVPVAVLTGANHIYLIQKGSLIVDTVNDVLSFDATPYMAYDDMPSFTGTWRLYFAAATVQSGDQILSNSSSYIVPQHNVVIKRTLSAGDTFQILTSQLTSSRQVTFQLHLIQPSTAVSFTLPNNLIWRDTDHFSSQNTPPAMNTGNTLYCIVIRWDGTALLANLAYTKETS